MVSPSGTILVKGTAGAITDSKGNVWTISATGLVVENGVADHFTANVTELAFKNGVLWQENTSNLWYAKVGNVPGSYHGWSAGTYIPPLPITRTFGDNSAPHGGSANYPITWGYPASSGNAGLPQPGDTLNFNGGVMQITGNALAGNALHLNASSTASQDGPVQINVTGITPMNLVESNPGQAHAVTVNLAANSEWIGGFTGSLSGPPLTVSGAGSWSNTRSTFDGNATIGVNVVGSGVFNVEASHATPTIEFVHSVGAGQQVNISGYELYGGERGNVLVDDYKDFHAAVQLGFGQITLEGLHATSYSFKNDLLSMFNGKNVIDTMRLSIATPQNGADFFGNTAFGLSQIAAGVVIHQDGPAGSSVFDYHSGGVSLPVHA